MQLVDANVLLYAVNESAEDHDLARRWLSTALGGVEGVGFAWVVILAFLRLATHRAAFARPLSVGQAALATRQWLEAPASVIVSPGPRHLDLLGGLLGGSGSAGNLVTDAHLAALAIEHEATVVTFDTDFQRFPRIRTVRPGEEPRARSAQRSG